MKSSAWVLLAAAVAAAGVCAALLQDRAAGPPLAGRAEQGADADGAAMPADVDVPPVESASREPARQTVAAATPRSGKLAASAAPSAITLRIGDGWSFAGAAVIPCSDRNERSGRSEADLWCLDVRETVALRCAFGAATALAPMTGIGLPETSDAAAALLVDAPAELDAGDLQLATRPTPERAGLGFVRSRGGATFAIWIHAIADDPDALQRTVQLRFAAVPAVPGGGALRLPRTLGTPAPETLQQIRDAQAIGDRLPGDSFAHNLHGPFTTVEDPPREFTSGDGTSLAFGTLTDQKVVATSVAAIYAAAVGRDAHVVLQQGGAAVIGSNLEGTLRTDGYAYLFVGGDVTGTLDVRSYTTAVVLGDVRGTLRVRSYTTLYVRGRILGTLDLRDSGWCTFWFQSFLARADLERLPGSSTITLHVMLSDLPPGRHEGVGAWREVIVGDPAWQQIAR